MSNVCGTFGCDRPAVIHGIRGEEWIPGSYCADHGKNVDAAVSSGSGSYQALGTQVVALWHTNVVLLEVPCGLTDQEVSDAAFALIDKGEVVFESMEGGVDRSPPEWWLDHAATPLATPDRGASQ